MKRDRGLAIFTALFAVTLLFMTVLALVVQARQNLRLTVQSQVGLQHRFLARGAAQQALANLNADPAWAAAHDAPARAERIVIDGTPTLAWIESDSSPDVYSVRGQAGEEVATVSVYRTPLALAGLLASTRGEGVFRTSPSGSGWTGLPQLPRLGWRPASPPRPFVGSPPRLGPDERRTEAVAGGPSGVIFVATRVGPGVSVLMLGPGASQWGLLPPVHLSTGELATAINQLAVQGERVYGVAGAGPGSGELVYLDDPAAVQTSWDPLTGQFTPAPGRWSRLELPVGEVQAVAASQNGQLYAVVERQIWQRVPSTGGWVRLPRPPRQCWVAAGAGFELREAGEGPGRQGLTSDPQGNLYLSREIDQVATMFKFIPGREPGTGTFRLLPPFRGQSTASDDLAHDYAGLLYKLVESPSGQDVLLSAGTSNAARATRFRPLEGPPTSDGSIDAIGPGGTQDASQLRYLPRYSD